LQDTNTAHSQPYLWYSPSLSPKGRSTLTMHFPTAIVSCTSLLYCAGSSSCSVRPCSREGAFGVGVGADALHDVRLILTPQHHPLAGVLIYVQRLTELSRHRRCSAELDLLCALVCVQRREWWFWHRRQCFVSRPWWRRSRYGERGCGGRAVVEEELVVG
jgi:hypothetical protein